MARIARLVLFALALLVVAAGARTARADATSPCVDLAPGTAVAQPPDLFSQNGTLNVSFNYFTAVNSGGLTVFCFVTLEGLQSPTLHIKPGDTLNITLTNQTPAPPPEAPTAIVADAANACGDVTMTITSVNMHFHGTNTSPNCHADETTRTIVNSGQTFKYSLTFPTDEPPGLYWYHPHVHGLSEAAVQGGASGAIEVQGIANVQPAVANLPEQFLLIRDMNRINTPDTDQGTGPLPAWDVSLNYVPIHYPDYQPAVLNIAAGSKQFWRVLNASADQTIDVQVQYDGVAQTLQVTGLDGVPTGSQNGTATGSLVPMTHILLPPASRAEFIITGPGAGVSVAQLLTLAVDTGPSGEIEPTRPLANISTAPPAIPPPTVTTSTPATLPPRLGDLAQATPTATRLLYFSEDMIEQGDDADENPTNFFITVDGAEPVLFDPNLPPAIVTTQNSIEDWTIENRADELHMFHMHQIHFLVTARNGVPVPASEQQYLDTVEVPYWTGDGPYPSVTVRMDFRGMDIGDFVYHCHILAHEDAGMMAKIRVLPAATSPTNVVSAVLPQSRSVQVGKTATAFATIANAGTSSASACKMQPQVSLPASFNYQTTDPVTNVPTGVPNTPIDIGAGQSQSFVFALTPTSPISPTDVALSFSCDNAPPAPVSEVNVLNLSATAAPTPDVIALAASGDPGYVDLPGNTGAGAFAVATFNLGAAAPISVSADTGNATLPLTTTVCQTNPVSGACLASPAATVTTTMAANAAQTFGIFVSGTGVAVPDAPDTNRVIVRFTDAGGALRGKTSVAVRTK